MRPSTACVECRRRRRKCLIEAQGCSCVSCERRDIPCSLTSLSLGSDNPGTTTLRNVDVLAENVFHSNQPQSPSLPPLAVCLELTELYFRYIHDTFHTLFHPPSVIEDVRSGCFPQVLLLGMMSLSARFSSNNFFAGDDLRTRGRVFAEAAEFLWQPREVSLTTVQTAILLGAFFTSEGEPAAEAVYISVACRCAMLLDLPKMPVASLVEQENNRRVWWSLKNIDVWVSSAFDLKKALSARQDVPYPMEETVFLQHRRRDLEVSTRSLVPNPAASLLTQMTKLNAIFARIQDLNRLAVCADFSPQQFQLKDKVNIIAQDLEIWYSNLPLGLQDTHANLSHYASLGLGSMFVAVYLGYYHYGQLLYYQFLHKSEFDGPTYVTAFAEKCKAYSTALLEITYNAFATPGCEVYYTMVGHVIVIASTVQLHVLLFGTDEMQIRAARSRLEKNFEILMKLQTYWPSLDICFSRLREFHKTCEKSREGSFRMDRWMLQFLFEFMKPMDEKEDFEFDEDAYMSEMLNPVL